MTLLLGTACSQVESEMDATKPDSSSRMVWAHFVTWPVDAKEKFDDPSVNWPRYADRTRLGESVGTREGLTVENCRLQIEAARQYGIDGFAVDVPNSKHYVSSMSRVYEAAEGTDFKVSLCVDGWNRGEKSVERSVKDLVRFFEIYGSHPNNYYIDGKPVIYIYKTQVPLETSQAIVEGLKAAGYEAYWLVQAERETAGFWENESLLDAHLKVFDGLYDFGLNGYRQDQMELRLKNGRRALERAGKDGLLVGGITPGYAGAHNAYYRPGHGTRTIRDNWQSAIGADVDWVCITTWNDYTESTQFEPAVWGRDVRLVINQAFDRVWRGEAPKKADAEVVLSYKPFIRLGDEWTIEVLNLGYDGAEAQCFVKLTDLEGQILTEFNPVRVSIGTPVAEVLRVESPGVGTPYDFQVWSAVVDTGESPSAGDWQPLLPVSVNAGVMLDMKTLQMRSQHWKGAVSVDLDLNNPNEMIMASLPADVDAGGQMELIRNDIIVSKQVLTADATSCFFGAADTRMIRLEDLYTVRYSLPDGSYAISKSFHLSEQSAEVVRIPVLWRDGDFDETWTGFPDVQRREERDVPVGRIYGFEFPMDGGNNSLLESDGTWPVVAVGGGTHWGRYKEECRPLSKEEVLPDGQVRSYLSFDGKNDRVVVQARSLPQDVMTVEVRFRTDEQAHERYLLSDASQALRLGITGEGMLFAERGARRVVSSKVINHQVWQHAAVIYDGEALSLTLNGELLAHEAVASTIRPINSVMAIGCKNKEGLYCSAYFEGDIAGVAVAARPLRPDEYQLEAFDE